MARGYPDYSRSVGVTPEGDRLQQIAVAPVWFEDNFEEPFNKWLSSSGTIQMYAIGGSGVTEAPVYEGAGCMSIQSVVGSVGDLYRTIGPPPITHNIGMETFFYLVDADKFSTTIGYNEFLFMMYYDGTNLHYISLAYVHSTGKWYITDDNATTWTEVLTKKVQETIHHHVKITFNLTTLKYIAFWVDGVKTDLSDYDIGTTADSTDTSCIIGISFYSFSVNVAQMYLDRFRVTHGES